MSNTIVELRIPPYFGADVTVDGAATPRLVVPTLLKLTKTDAAQVTPAASYALSLVTGWLYQVTVPEALVGPYYWVCEDADTNNIRDGYVNIEADDTNTYRAMSDFAVAELASDFSSLVTQLAAIQAKTDLLGTGSATISQPVAQDGQITEPIVIGDDYLDSLGRAFVWTVDKLPGIDVGDASCKFGAAAAFKEPATNKWSVNGAVSANADPNKWDLTFDLARADTVNLDPDYYDWSTEVRDNTSKQVTRVRNKDHNYRVELVKKQTT